MNRILTAAALAAMLAFSASPASAVPSKCEVRFVSGQVMAACPFLNNGQRLYQHLTWPASPKTMRWVGRTFQCDLFNPGTQKAQVNC